MDEGTSYRGEQWWGVHRMRDGDATKDALANSVGRKGRQPDEAEMTHIGRSKHAPQNSGPERRAGVLESLKHP